MAKLRFFKSALHPEKPHAAQPRGDAADVPIRGARRYAE